VHLPVPFCLITRLLSNETIADASFVRVNVSCSNPLRGVWRANEGPS
jgi:hypothetical protein